MVSLQKRCVCPCIEGGARGLTMILNLTLTPTLTLTRQCLTDRLMGLPDSQHKNNNNIYTRKVAAWWHERKKYSSA